MNNYFQPAPGTRVGVHQNRKSEDPVPCTRCGHPRQRSHASKAPTGLCRDCRYTMSTEEIALWAQSTRAA